MVSVRYPVKLGFRTLIGSIAKKVMLNFRSFDRARELERDLEIEVGRPRSLMRTQTPELNDIDPSLFLQPDPSAWSQGEFQDVLKSSPSVHPREFLSVVL